MNTDKTLTTKFCNKEEYPIWYYKELRPVDIDYVILYLLLESRFVVELEDKKLDITFGKNRKHEIGSSQFCPDGLDYTSFECINKSFKEGKWFIVTENDTTDEFKEEYRKEQELKEKQKTREAYIDILSNAIVMSRKQKGFDFDRESIVNQLNKLSDEELDKYMDVLVEKLNRKVI